MAEIKITGAVGAPPAKNFVIDVRTVQSLLKNVQPPLALSITPTGQMDSNTLNCILEYQRRFMSNPDGIIEPNKATLMRLNREPTVDNDFKISTRWIDQVNQRLVTAGDADMKKKLKNIFHLEFDKPGDAFGLQTLRANFPKLRQSFNTYIPRAFHPAKSIFQAWIDLSDPKGTIHFPRNHFDKREDERVEKVIHERSHTILKISHAGMAGAGEVAFGQNPDDDNGLTFNHAIANAYCYGWRGGSPST